MNNRLIQSIYNPNYIDFSKEKLFFGEGRNSQRFDILRYPIFDRLGNEMTSFEWSFDEINLNKDKEQFNAAFTDPMKHIYTRVLNKLIFLDSVQGRGMLQTFGSVITLPELETAVTIWQNFECKHSKSYTHILQSVYNNPTEIFDESFNIKELVSLAEKISKSYNDAFDKITEYNYKCIKGMSISDNEILEMKKAIVRMFIEINILEGIRFYSGFSIIWSFHFNLGLAEKTGKILQLICRDENLHLAITQTILKLFKTKEDEGFKEAYEFWEPQIPQIYKDVVKQEFEWIDYLFQFGSPIIGMSADIAKQYIKYICNKRLKALGINSIFDGASKNPIPWVDNYIMSDGVERLPQEAEVQNYRMNILNMNISDNEMLNLSKLLK